MAYLVKNTDTGITHGVTAERFERLKNREGYEVVEASEETKTLEDHTVTELKEVASNLGLEGYSSMKKAELVEVITQAKTVSN